MRAPAHTHAERIQKSRGAPAEGGRDRRRQRRAAVERNKGRWNSGEQRAPRLPLRGCDVRAMPPLNGNGERGVLGHLIRDFRLGLPQRRTYAGGLGAVLSHPLASSVEAERTVGEVSQTASPAAQAEDGIESAAEQLVLGIPRRRMRLGTQRTGSGCAAPRRTPRGELLLTAVPASTRGGYQLRIFVVRTQSRHAHVPAHALQLHTLTTRDERGGSGYAEAETENAAPLPIMRRPRPRRAGRHGASPYIVRRGPSPPPIRPANGTRELRARRVAQVILPGIPHQTQLRLEQRSETRSP
jgi:hypothetical protein